MIPTTTPTADLRLVYTPDPASGTTLVDLALSPHHDLMLVWGLDRLEQDVRRWLQLALGHYPFDITWGNPLWAELGRPMPGDPASLILAALSVAETNFLLAQATAAQQGYLSTDEQLDRFENVQVTLPADQPGVVVVDIILVARSGNNRPAELWVPIGPSVRRVQPPPPPRPILTTRQARVGLGQETTLLVTYSGTDTLHLSVPRGVLSRTTITPSGPGGVPVTYEVRYTAPDTVAVEQAILVFCTDTTDVVTLTLFLEPDPLLELAWSAPTLIVGGVDHPSVSLMVSYSGRETITLSVSTGSLAQTTIVGTGAALTLSIGYAPPSGLDHDAGALLLPGSGFWPQTWPYAVIATGSDVSQTVHATLLLLSPIAGSMAGEAGQGLLDSGSMAGGAGQGTLSSGSMAGGGAAGVLDGGSMAGGVALLPGDSWSGGAFAGLFTTQGWSGGGTEGSFDSQGWSGGGVIA